MSPARLRRLLLVALLVAVCVGVAMRVGNLTAMHHTPDEWSYTSQAALVLKEGRGAFPDLVAAFHRDTGLPPPTRAGFLYLLAGVMAVTGRTDLMPGIWLSCVASMISLLLVARIGWRFLGPTAAVFATVFYAVSSLPLMTSRRAWQDATVEMLALLLILSGGEIVSGAKHWGWSLGFCLTGAACLTMKEMPATIFLLLTACVLISLMRRPLDGTQLVVFGGIWIISVAAAVSWLIFLLGDWRPLVEYPRLTSAFLANGTYSQNYESGSALDLMRGFLVVSPFAAFCFPLGLTELIAPKFFTVVAESRLMAYFLAIFTLLLMAAAVIVPHHLNFRYICPAFGPFYLVAGLGFSGTIGAIMQHFSVVQRRAFAGCCVLAILLYAGGDVLTFENHFVRTEVRDLSIRMVINPEAADEL
jgi:hypothetical protein